MAKKEDKPRRGRPTDYDDAIARRILAGLLTRQDGTDILHTVRTLCEADPTLPSERTFYNWLTHNDDLLQRYARVREERAHMIVDEIVHIADTEEDTNKARVRIDARKWYAGKVAQKYYAEKTTVDMNVNGNLTRLSDAELEYIAAAGREGTAEETANKGKLN